MRKKELRLGEEGRDRGSSRGT